jgi:hypothetical protein
MLQAASAPAQSARHPHRKMVAQRLMKDTDVAVKEAVNGMTASSLDLMIYDEDSCDVWAVLERKRELRSPLSQRR